MARKQTTQPSAPTMMRWLKTYYTWLPDLIEGGGLYPEHGKRVAKGLKYAIKALDDSAKEYKKLKQAESRRNLNEEVESTDEYFS